MKEKVVMGFWIAAGFAAFGIVAMIARGALGRASSVV